MSIHNPPRRELLLITVQSPTAFFWRFFFGKGANKHIVAFCHSPIVNSVRIWRLGIARTTTLAQCASRAFTPAISYCKGVQREIS